MDSNERENQGNTDPAERCGEEDIGTETKQTDAWSGTAQHYLVALFWSTREYKVP